MQTLTPFLWFDNNLEEAMEFYLAVFKDAKVTSISDLGNSMKMATFEILGQKFMALQAGPIYKFTEAISFFISCDDQSEVDYYWERLGDGGDIQMCGWLKDKFGLSWQIIPTALGRLMGDENPAKSHAVMQAMLQMKKIEVGDLQAAYDKA